MIANPLQNQEAAKKLKDELKKIKALTTSVLVADPSMQDNTSEMISKIGVLVNGGSNKRQ